ncbi:MAG TPA: methyltransferase domain-containing protein [Nitrospiraceae bacterium]|nr:methyltransferase domain-containing protein [Nitrospiraceae bacterium]
MVHKLPKAKLVTDRNNFVVEYCTGKSVLHLGCAADGTAENFAERGIHLHLQLLVRSKRVIGLDTSEAALNVLRERGVEDLIRWDVERLLELNLDGPIDVIVLGEILEHLANPGLCLHGLASYMAKFNATSVITVPNAFSVRHLLCVALKRTELVWPDHTAYYSIATLGSLLNRYGLVIEEIAMYSNVGTVENRLKRLAKICFNKTILAASPLIAEGIIAVVKQKPSR